MHGARTQVRRLTAQELLGEGGYEPLSPRHGTLPQTSHGAPMTLHRGSLPTPDAEQGWADPSSPRPSSPGARGGSLPPPSPSPRRPAAPRFHDSERARRHWRFAREHVPSLMARLDSASAREGLLGEHRLASRAWLSSDRHTIAESFLTLVAGAELGTGAVLRSQALQSERRPGLWAPRTDLPALRRLFLGSVLNVLLVCAPLGIYAGHAGWSASAVFWLNFVALLPLALLLGEVTEDLAVRFGDVVGGLLNATLGNVVELILSIAALSKGLYTVVATSLVGSILSNLLLVLGMCFFCGGLRYREQRFSQMANKVGSSLLFLAAIGIIVPSTAKAIYGPAVVTDDALLALSRAIAALLAGVYLCYLLFQLKTHAECFVSEQDDAQPALSGAGAAAVLAGCTVVIALCSEELTGAIEEVARSTGLNQAFLGLIVLPIAGNACEHITAVFVAMKNKMDLAIAVALGSSTQIALFVVPVTVLAGWAMGQPFTLEFDLFSVIMLTVSVILAYFVSSDGQSNWLLGLQLICTYLLIAIVFLLEHEAPEPKP